MKPLTDYVNAKSIEANTDERWKPDRYQDFGVTDIDRIGDPKAKKIGSFRPGLQEKKGKDKGTEGKKSGDAKDDAPGYQRNVKKQPKEEGVIEEPAPNKTTWI